MYFIYYLILFVAGPPLSSALETPNLNPFVNDLTTGTIASMSNVTRGYRPANVRQLMLDSRRRTRRWYDGMSNHKNEFDIMRICYNTYIPYRSSLWDLKRYYNIRYLYVGNLDFEVGYLTHEIVYRYQVVLELYQIVERRYVPYPEEHYLPATVLLYLYVNILEQCKEIVHLVNMLHELEAKYDGIEQSGVFYDTEDARIVHKRNSKKASNLVLKEQTKWQKWVSDKRMKKQSKLKLWQKQRKKSTSIPNYKTTPWFDKERDIIYGWSIEDWWQMSSDESDYSPV